MTVGKSVWNTVGEKTKEDDDKTKKNKNKEKMKDKTTDKEPKKEGQEEVTLREVYQNLGKTYKKMIDEIGRVVVGQDDAVKQILVAIFTDNHALLEGYPGLGKTLMVRTIANIMDLNFKRIQCTPDLMPSDITGTYFVEEDASGRKKLRFVEGPVFTNILLADEINRATPKAQSALLEAMQERQVTAGMETYKLERPFFVLATQNPIEMEGTYPLPEAQVDRFILKVLIEYPTRKEEDRIIELYSGEDAPQSTRVLDRKHVLGVQELTRKMPISDEIRGYALDIINATRPSVGGIAKKYLDYGASPRAAIGLVLASKAHALISGRNFVSREDVSVMALPVLRHRLILNFESERKGISTDDVVREIIKGV